MRKHKVTIRELSRRMGITMKRIRQVRKTGLDRFPTYLDWYEGITGEMSPEIRAAWDKYRAYYNR